MSQRPVHVERAPSTPGAVPAGPDGTTAQILDVHARDGFARTATWTRGAIRLAIPLLLHVHTSARPAPGFAAAVLARAVHPERPTVLHRGTWFSPPAADDPAAVMALPRGLVYPVAAGPELLAAAAAENAKAAGAGTAALLLDPAAPSAADAPLVVAAGARASWGDPWTFPPFAVGARAASGWNALLYMPGMGLPDEMALLAYAGVDVFDTAAAHLATAEGLFATPEGLLRQPEDEAPPCACPGCLADDLRLHNLWACELERRRVAMAIRSGRLRELVEVRVRSRPELVATLRRFDRDHGAAFEAVAPVARPGTLAATSEDSLRRPEVARWVPRLEARYTPPPSARVLVVVPCAATKPYSDSPTHQRIDAVIARHGKGLVHKVVLTSPLGAVPSELELAYPAGAYDIPVTGTWYDVEVEAIRRSFTHLAATKRYERVVVHLAPDEAALLRGVFPGAAATGGERPTSAESLAALGSALDAATEGTAPVAARQRFFETMVGRAAWQFGPAAGAALCAEAQIRGRYPFLKLLDASGVQLAMLLPQRGLLSLTLDGARRVASEGAYLVEIDDFVPRGSVFAKGVRAADPAIRVGDDVVVVHGTDVRGTGKATMCGAEMAAATRGVAVEVRHHA